MFIGVPLGGRGFLGSVSLIRQLVNLKSKRKVESYISLGKVM